VKPKEQRDNGHAKETELEPRIRRVRQKKYKDVELVPVQGPGVVPFWCEMPVWDDLCEYEVMRERGVSACRRDEGARLR
jgi:hypothetical protein